MIISLGGRGFAGFCRSFWVFWVELVLFLGVLLLVRLMGLRWLMGLMGLRRCWFILLCCVSVGLVSCSPVWSELIRRDDYQNFHTWWEWGGQDTPRPWIADGLVHLLLDGAMNHNNCGASMWDGDNIYGYVTATIRIRTLTPMRPGTMGWGFWEYKPSLFSCFHS